MIMVLAVYLNCIEERKHERSILFLLALPGKMDLKPGSGEVTLNEFMSPFPLLSCLIASTSEAFRPERD